MSGDPSDHTSESDPNWFSRLQDWLHRCESAPVVDQAECLRELRAIVASAGPHKHRIFASDKEIDRFEDALAGGHLISAARMLANPELGFVVSNGDQAIVTLSMKGLPLDELTYSANEEPLAFAGALAIALMADYSGEIPEVALVPRSRG